MSRPASGGFGRAHRTRIILLVAIAGITMLIPVGPASGSATLSFGAVADARILASQPTTNFGAKPRLAVDNAPVKHTLIRYDVTGVGSDRVESATLRLHSLDASGVGGILSRALDDDWSETSVTWNTAPAALPTPTATLGAVAANTWVEFDVSSLVTGDGPLSVRISSSSSDGVEYVSRQGTAALRPQLVVVTSPADDTRAPTVSITDPSQGETVSGEISVGVDAVDDVGVSSVALSVDGHSHGSDTTAPYAFAVDTRAFADGEHTLLATATDPAGNSGVSPPVVVQIANPEDPSSFTFAAAGDHASNVRTDANLAALDASDAEFYLALGDLDYNADGLDPTWCSYVTSHLPTKGPSFPFQLVSGNHEQQGHEDGYILNHTACLPDRLGSTPAPGSVYGANYSFDHPQAAPLMRVIMISPGLTIEGVRTSFGSGSSNRAWLTGLIDDARADGIPWVTVGMHYNCLTVAARPSCEMSSSLWNLLLSKGVDLVLNAHEHTYQRTKQLDLDPLVCPAVVPHVYTPGCVVDDGADGIYPKGAGTVNVVAGTFGAPLGSVNPNDTEAPYFARMDDTTWGFMRYTVTPRRIDATFVNTTGAFTDHFSILASAEPGVDLIPPTAPTDLVASLASDGVKLTWTAADDAVGVHHYSVLRDGVDMGISTTTSYVDRSAVPGATHVYVVRAHDAAGNTGPPATAVITVEGDVTTLTFAPTADATVLSDSPTVNTGGAASLLVDGLPGKEFLIRFDVTGVGDRIVTDARIRLYCTNPSDSGGAFFPAEDAPWCEGTVTWNTAPEASAPAVATLGGVTAETWYEVDLAGAVGGDGSYTFRVATDSTNGADYRSRQASAAFRPQLVVSVEP